MLVSKQKTLSLGQKKLHMLAACYHISIIHNMMQLTYLVYLQKTCYMYGDVSRSMGICRSLLSCNPWLRVTSMNDGPMECWLSELESPGGGLKWEKAPKEWQNMIKFTVIETCQCRTEREREIAITSLLVYNYMVIDRKQVGIYHMQLHGFFNSPNQKKKNTFSNFSGHPGFSTLNMRNIRRGRVTWWDSQYLNYWDPSDW